jgi:outer membrane protein TolC
MIIRKNKLLFSFTLTFAFLLIFSLGKSCNLLAQTNLTLEEAIKIGIKNSPDLKQSILETQKAEAVVNEVFGNALPSVDLTASFSHAFKLQQIPFPDFAALIANSTYGVLFEEGLLEYDASKLPPMGNTLMSMQQKNNIQGQIQLTQILFNSAVFTGIGVSKDYLQVSKSQYNAKLADLIMNVKNTFNSVLYTREMLKIINESYKNAEENLKNVMSLAAEGLVSEFTTLEAQVRVENIKPQIRQVENGLNTAIDGLKVIIGISQNETINVVGEIEYINEEIPNLEKAIETAKENNLNLQTLENLKIVNQANTKVSESGYYPTLAGFANVGYSGMGDNFSDFQTFTTSSAGISLSMNLFKGMQTKYQVQQAKIEVLKVDEQINQLKSAIEMQIKTNINELVRIKEDIDAQERNVKVAERAYELATLRFKEGTGSQLEISNSDLALSQAKTNKLESILNYSNSKANLENLLGIVFEDWLIK